MDSFSKLPKNLFYLIEPAKKYGICHWDNQVDEFLDTASDEDMEYLENLAGIVRMGGDFKRVREWLLDYPITEYSDSADLYFLFGVLDAAGFTFDD